MASEDLFHALSEVRALRADPPAFASSGKRSKVFAAALEQFEQLELAADAVGPAAAPIPMFYAPSQAGRAIVAAWAGEVWEPHGHGLKVIASRAPIGDTAVRPEGSGLFQAVASATQSPWLGEEISLGALWGALPRLHRGEGLGADEPPIFMADAASGPRGKGWTIRDERGELLRDADLYLGRRELYPGNDAQVEVREQGEYRVVSIEFASDREASAFETELWALEGASYLRVPPGGAAGAQLSGLMTWWAILLALSQLARYEPASWVNALAPDRSPLAVPIERSLRRATLEIPRLVVQALTSVPGQLSTDECEEGRDEDG